MNRQLAFNDTMLSHGSSNEGLDQATIDLFEAVEEGDEKGVIKAIESGANFDTVKEMRAGHMIPLQIATMKGHEDCFSFLIEIGARPDAHQNEAKSIYSSLHWAASYNRVCFIKRLLMAGANPSYKSRTFKREIPRDLAASRKHNEVVAIFDAWERSQKAADVGTRTKCPPAYDPIFGSPPTKDTRMIWNQVRIYLGFEPVR